MALKAIKMTSGTFGYWDGSKVVPKTPEDAPFLIDEGRASELVELGIAKFVDEELKTEEEKAADEAADLQLEAELEAENIAEDIGVDLEVLKVEELKKIAKPYGVEWKAGMKKADLIDAIKVAMNGDSMNGTEDPDNEEDEQAFLFDAADAVQ